MAPDAPTAAEALSDLGRYADLAAEAEGLRACYLQPIAAHPDRRVGEALARLEGELSATLEALAALQALAA